MRAERINSPAPTSPARGATPSTSRLAIAQDVSVTFQRRQNRSVTQLVTSQRGEELSAPSLENAPNFRQVLVPSRLSPLIRLQSWQPETQRRHVAAARRSTANRINPTVYFSGVTPYELIRPIGPCRQSRGNNIAGVHVGASRRAEPSHRRRQRCFPPERALLRGRAASSRPSREAV